MKRWIPIAPILLLSCTPEEDIYKPDDLAADRECSEMYQQSILPEYHVEISDSEWAKLEDEFLNRVEREAAGMNPTPYHPIKLTYKADGESEDAGEGVLIRLKGASSWLQTIQLDPNPKMQFVIAFNEVDPGGRFKGQRKVELDMPRSDQTFLKHRVGLSFMREAGLPAQCANSARLYINGEYYGLYSNIERMDKEFLERVFPGAEDGDLWKSGREIKTNEDTFSWERLDAFWHVADMTSLDTLADVDAAFYEWAAEAMIGDADGYYNGRANFYLYDHPTRGFVWIPQDLDTTLDDDYLPEDASPIFPPCVARWERDWFHYVMAMRDPASVEGYVAALADVRSKYDAATIQARIDDYQLQIVGAADEDPHRPFTMDDHGLAVMRIHDYAIERPDYIDAWLACRASGGPDADGDGSDMCHDCNDGDAAVHPGAAETCNAVDDDCDGHTDNIEGVSVCQ